jgi:N-acetyl-gamma-glutamyl-phosphate reductase
MTTVGIVGGSGFTGAELLRLLAGHPDLEVKVATGASQAGTKAGDLYPSLAAAYPELVFQPTDLEGLDGLDLAFCCLPHGESGALMAELRKRVGVVVDLAADFRLQDAALYPQWYGDEHPDPALLPDFAYGLPELFREDLVGADAVAAPGCYPTAAALALAPLVQAGLIEATGIVVDAASGVSGAGRGLKQNTAFTTVDEDVTAYGLLDHRHTPEIEQTLTTVGAGASGETAQVIFTPHLVPMNRGMLATCYARPTGDTSTDEVLGVLRAAYADEPFVVVDERSPSTKAALGSNTAHLTARHDVRTGWVVAIAAIDNLTKGASGQALQCANLALGLDEGLGLSQIGTYP